MRTHTTTTTMGDKERKVPDKVCTWSTLQLLGDAEACECNAREAPALKETHGNHSLVNPLHIPHSDNPHTLREHGHAQRQ